MLAYPNMWTLSKYNIFTTVRNLHKFPEMSDSTDYESFQSTWPVQRTYFLKYLKESRVF